MQAESEPQSVKFRADGSVGAIYKADSDDDGYVIWGPASVEVVDKEDDRIKASALEDALPQLLKRSTLSYEHSDQIVGEIIKEFETEEPVTVKIGDHEITRQDFPTDVLKNEIDDPALFVAGKVYGDTKKSQEVREGIEDGDIRSFSISGEAITSKMSVEDGRPITDIEKLDLSAVTLCREGMNQKSKFGVVKKMDAAEGPVTTPVSQQQAGAVLKSKTMGDNEDDPLTKSGMDEMLDKHLPDGEIATKDDVESIARDTAEEVVKENATNTGSPSDGTPERPSGDGDGGTEQDPEFEGDNENSTDDSDKVEEKMHKMSLSDIEEALPADQYKAIEPTLKEKLDVEEEDDPALDDDPMGDDEPEVAPPDDDDVPEMDDEDDEPALDVVEEKAKSLGMDPATLTAEQREKLKSVDLSDLNKSEGVKPGAGGVGSQPGHSADMTEEELAKSEGTTVSGSNFFGNDGEVKL